MVSETRLPESRQEPPTLQQEAERLSFELNEPRNNLLQQYRRELNGAARPAPDGRKVAAAYQDALTDAALCLCLHPANSQKVSGCITESDLVGSLLLVSTLEEAKRLSGLDSIYAGAIAGRGAVKRTNGVVAGGPVNVFAKKRGLPQFTSPRQVAAAHHQRVRGVIDTSLMSVQPSLVTHQATGERCLPIEHLLGVVPNAINVLLNGSIPTEAGELKRAVAEAKIRKGWLVKLFS